MDMLQIAIKTWNQNLQQAQGELWLQAQARRVLGILYAIMEGAEIKDALPSYERRSDRHFNWRLVPILDQAGLYGPPSPPDHLADMAAEIEEAVYASMEEEYWENQGNEARGLPRYSDEDLYGDPEEGGPWMSEEEAARRDRWAEEASDYDPSYDYFQEEEVVIDPPAVRPTRRRMEDDDVPF